MFQNLMSTYFILDIKLIMDVEKIVTSTVRVIQRHAREFLPARDVVVPGGHL